MNQTLWETYTRKQVLHTLTVQFNIDMIEWQMQDINSESSMIWLYEQSLISDSIQQIILHVQCKCKVSYHN